VRLPTGDLARWEVHASQTAYEALWRLAAVYGQALLRGRLTHAGRALRLGEPLAIQRVLPGALLTLTYAPDAERYVSVESTVPRAAPPWFVLVRMPSGRILTYEARPDGVLSEIVPWAESSTGERLPDVKLTINGRVLDARHTFAAAQVRMGAIISLAHRTRGGSQSPVPVAKLRELLTAAKLRQLGKPGASSRPPVLERAIVRAPGDGAQEWMSCCTDPSESAWSGANENAPPPNTYSPTELANSQWRDAGESADECQPANGTGCRPCGHERKADTMVIWVEPPPGAEPQQVHAGDANPPAGQLRECTMVNARSGNRPKSAAYAQRSSRLEKQCGSARSAPHTRVAAAGPHTRGLPAALSAEREHVQRVRPARACSPLRGW
jgi:hypothetical protein